MFKLGRKILGFRPLFAARKNMFILLSAYTRFNNGFKNVSFIVFVNFCLPEISLKHVHLF